MAFYIRKAFRTGPVRLNLSKGGLGLSAGVTGARAGINSRGLYVHGGRHGLYYRKYARQGRKSDRRLPVLTRSGTQPSPGGTEGPRVDLFRDTGVTFVAVPPTAAQVPKSLVLPGSKLLSAPVRGALWLAAFMLLLSVVLAAGEPAMLALLIAVVTGGWTVREYLWSRRARKKLDQIVTRTESEGSLPPEISTEPNFPDRWREWLALHLHAVIGELAMREERIDTLPTLRALDNQVPIDRTQVDRIRVSILGAILDEMLEDHLLSEEEEQAIRMLIDQLGIPEELIGSEKHRLEYYNEVRRQIERPLEEVDPGVPLLRGEKAYDLFDQVRLLNERVLNRFRRDRVQYREIGYEIDLEGKLILTDRRLLFVGRGSREYRLNRLLDVTADPEAGIVELTLDGRKSPVLITAPQVMVLAARVEKISDEVVRT